MTKEITHVAILSDIPPGRMHYAEVDGLPIALANVAGAIYAFGDSCRHEGGPLSAGVLIEHTVTCPWHGWTYDVRTGKAIVPPVGIRVPTYEVRVEGQDVYVVIDWPDA
jgi:nitrite reductase/ring-hydroxylating ferredoxin subunit